jgi:hypothetical protein
VTKVISNVAAQLVAPQPRHGWNGTRSCLDIEGKNEKIYTICLSIVHVIFAYYFDKINLLFLFFAKNLWILQIIEMAKVILQILVSRFCKIY